MLELGHGLDALEAWRDGHDAAVAASPDLDSFCSRSDWVLPFARSHAPDLPVRVARRERAHVALACSDHDELGPIWHAIEHAWRFASPIAGEGAEELLLELVDDDGAQGHGDTYPIPGSRAPVSAPQPATGNMELGTELPPLSRCALLVSGIQAGPRLQRLLLALSARRDLYRLPSTARAVASLQGGRDGYLGRRSRELRRNLRRAQRRAEQRGLRIERVLLTPPLDVTALYARVLDVERRSWKSLQHMGADSEPMRSFYDHMLHGLSVDGRARALLARLDGRDVGYLHGGQVGDHFRSLQFSYDDAHAALSIGNLMHLELVSWLGEDGLTSYDLGQQVDYKRHWSDGLRVTPNILAVPR